MSSTIATTPPAWKQWRLNPTSSTPASSTMLVNQHSLPRLPIPPLAVTLDKVLKSAKAVAQNEAEVKELERKISEFGRAGGVGEKLQERLEARRAKEESWIAEWWDMDGYMRYRDSVVVNVSYYYGFSRLPQAPQGQQEPAGGDPAYVAASIVSTALEFRRLIAKGLLEPEKAGKEGELCMESYKWAFNACRLPATGSDYAVKVAEDAPEAQHIVVVKNDRFYSVPFQDKDGRAYTVEELRRAFRSLLDSKAERGEGVGILTGINRDTWSEAHAHLLGSSTNSATLAAIHSSAFVLSFDEASPEPALHKIPGTKAAETSDGIKDFSERLWKAGGKGKGEGEAANRWWDKPQNWVVFSNGEAGFIGEHSCMDGTPTARLSDFVSKRLITQQPTAVGASDPAPVASPTVSELKFEVDDKTRQSIAAARKEFSSAVGVYDVHYLKYGAYGKEGIKRQKVSPDGWTQMVFQLAYFMTHGKACGTYEAAQVRRFRLGRTETVRICTEATNAFTQAMVDPSASDEARRAAFREAVKGHGEDMKNASAGMGIDRHLFGLRHVVEAGDSGADLLSDPLLARSSTWNMSTSQIFITHSPAYGWGPVVKDGYGLPYMIHPEHLQFTVTCHEDMPGKEFTNNLGKAADSIMQLMQGEEKSKL